MVLSPPGWREVGGDWGEEEGEKEKEMKKDIIVQRNRCTAKKQ